jgi:O-antigen/teichoic acid export membrane protein
LEQEAPAPAAPKRQGTLGRILENTGWLLSGKGVGAVLSLVYLGLATRSLGVEGFGQFALILGTAQMVAAFVGFQTWQIVVRYGMEHLHEGRRDKLSDVILLALSLDVAGALVGCLIVTAGMSSLGAYFGWTDELQRNALLFALVMLLSVHSTPVGVLRLHDKFGQGALADVVTPVGRLLGALVVVVLGPTVTGFLLVWACAEVATAGAYWWLASRTKSISLKRWSWRRMRQVSRDHQGLAGFAGITNINYTLAAVGRQFSTVIVGLFVGAAAAGQYRLVHQLGQALAKLGDLVARAIFAELTRVHVGEVRQNLVRLFRSAVLFSFAAAAVIVVLLLLAGKPVLGLVAGEAFLPAYPLLLLLGFAAALDLGGVSFEPALIATGRAGVALKLRIVVAATLLILLLILLPRLGTVGAGIATVSASILGLILFGAAAWRAIHR